MYNSFRNIFKIKTNNILCSCLNKRLYGRFYPSIYKQCKQISVQHRALSTSIGCFNDKYSIQEARFNSVFVNVNDEHQTSDEFQLILKGLLDSWKRFEKKSAFLAIPIDQSHLISVASSYGFKYHHARNDSAVLSLWLVEGKESKIPSYANHTVGVAGACFNEENNELLLVQDKGRYNKWWKFPGGFSDMKEFIGDTAVREVFEETGVKSDFKSLLSFRQQHDTIFGQSDLYFICRLHPLSYELTACPDEIERCEWMTIDRILSMNDTTPFVKLISRLMLDGKDKNFQNIDIIGEEVESWVTKNKKMILYHRDIDW